MKRSSKKTLIFTITIICLLLLSILIGYLLGFISFAWSPFVLTVDWEKEWLLFLGFVGALFAVIATYEASGAFKTSTEIMETIGSFRDDFEGIMKEMEQFIPGARKSLRIMVPTVFYGFLFGQEVSAQACLDGLNHKLEEINMWFNANGNKVGYFNLEIILINGGLQQNYLKMARDKNDDFFLRYRTGLENFFNSVCKFHQLLEMRKISQNDWPVKIYILENDPHIRIFIRDYVSSAGQTARAFISFTQSDCKETPFGAVGFVASRTEMIKAFDVLFQLFRNESKEMVVNAEFVDGLTRIKEG